MASTPAFISTPIVGMADLDTGQTARTAGTSSNVVDVTTAAPTAGTRVLEVVVKSSGQPADSVIVLWLHNGTTNHVFDEIDIGAPSAGSNTATAYRTNQTYQNLVIPSGWKLQASVTVTPTSGKIKVYALGGVLT